MGMSIGDYKALLAKQGKPVVANAWGSARMPASEYRVRVADGSLTTSAPAPQGATSPALGSASAHFSAPEPASPTTAPKKFKAQPEFESQCALFEWARAVEHIHPELALLSCSLNGVKLSRAQAGKAKAAGMLEGESDVRLPVSRGQWIGLLIEMKAGKNKPTEAQLRYGKLMTAEGHQFHVCYSWELAKDIIVAYLSQPRMHLVAG